MELPKIPMQNITDAGLSTDAKLNILMGHSMSLEKNVRFVLNNLEPDNLGAELSEKLANNEMAEALAGKLGRTEQAADSAKLDGKAPEYYTNPRNLLKNANFRDPVNTNGFVSGSTVGAWGGETINEWLAYASGATITLTSSGMSVLNGIYQKMEAGILAQYAGKTMTYAAKINGVVYAGSGVIKQTGAWHIVGQSATPYGRVRFEIQNDNKLFCVITSDQEATIEWACLYEGSYTADNVPPPFIYPQRLEMLNLGIPMQPMNLLDNSDFANPVNTNGQTSYTAAGYTIDGWLLASTGSPTCQLTDDAIVLTAETASTRLRQKIASIKDGIYTFAANVGEKIATRVVDIAGTTVTTINGGNAAYTGGYLECGTADGYIAMNVFVTAGNSITVYWAALYEGSYTPESLPPYVPKGYAVEALNCGVPVHPRNLLDNSDFTNPVNQRGITSLTASSTVYTIDRWRLDSGKTITVNANSITLDGGWLTQYIGDPIDSTKTYTAAALLNDGTLIVETGVPAGKTRKTYFGFDVTAAGVVYIGIRVAGTFKWAALYEGAYTAETLPTYVPKGYAAELAECKRYYQKIRFGNGYLMLYAFSDTIARTHWFIPGMRKIPSITCDIDLRLVSSSGYKVVTSYTVDGMTETGMMISMITAGLTAGEFCWTSPTSGYATIELSADL